MELRIPLEATELLNKIESCGYQAYIVGGAVRDLVRGEMPEDYDIATNAHPEEVRRIFPHTHDTGMKHGTVTVIWNEMPFEVTTFRKDGVYEDARHPEQVTFVSTIQEDLMRRDFTINAMAYHPFRGLVDPFGGVRDLVTHTIRAVGDARTRFREDALRMMRAARFSAQLGFQIEPGTFSAMQSECNLIRNISAERIQTELTKLLCSAHPDALRTLEQSGLLTLVLPEFSVCFGVPQHNYYHIYDVADHIIETVKAIPNSEVLRWAALFHDLGKIRTKTTDLSGNDHFYGHESVSADIALSVMERLRFGNQRKNKIEQLVRYHDRQIMPTVKSVKRAMSHIGAAMFPDLLELKYADLMAHNPEIIPEGRKELEKLRAIYEQILKEEEAFCLADLAINGYDVQGLGYQGKAVGRMLEQALDYVIEHPEANQKETLIKYLKEAR